MNGSVLTAAEQHVVKRLPKPPTTVSIRTSNVWIVEWLPLGDRRTGQELHEWMKSCRTGWSRLVTCRSSADVLRALDELAQYADQNAISPVLHIDAHGGDEGLLGPSDSGGMAPLTWIELTPALQRLNTITRCNLVLVVAACTGFAAIQALTSGPRAPVMALVGPDSEVTGKNLLEASKELYRRWQDDNPSLEEIVASANQQSPTVTFEIEPFTALAYEATVENLVLSMRPEGRLLRTERIRDWMRSEGKWPESEIEARLASLPQMPPSDELQQIWDQLFMIDLYPENRERFGLDMTEVAKVIARELG
jgi:hypothetical protein